MTVQKTLWLASGTEEMHGALCLPPEFRPATWAALLYQGADGWLGLRFVDENAAAMLVRAVCPAVGFSRTGDNFLVLKCSERGRRPFGEWIWLTLDSEATANVLGNIISKRALEAKKRVLQARYGRPSGTPHHTVIDSIVGQYPSVPWPIKTGLASPAGGRACSLAWYGFNSSFGDFAVAVGIDDQALEERLRSAGIPPDVRVVRATHSRQISTW